MRARALGIGVLLVAVARGAVACASFDAAPVDPASEGGMVPPHPFDDGGVDAPDGIRDPEAELESGCGVVPFEHRFSKPLAPLFEGWNRPIMYGPQEQLSLVQVPDAGVSGDGMLRVRIMPANPSQGRGMVVVHELRPANLACVGVEMTFRVDVPPANGEGVITAALRFEPDEFYGFALAAPNDLVIVQQSGGQYQVLGRAPMQVGTWHVARLVYRDGPVVEASLDGVGIALDLNPLMPFAGPSEFHAGVTYAPPLSTADFAIDAVRVF